MAHTNKGRKVALLAGLALVVLSVAMVWTYWGEIGFFLKFERLGKNAQGYPEYRHRRTGIVFVGLPSGTFDMGSPNSEAGRGEWEGPIHKVTLSPFLIAKYEVSQAEWQRVIAGNPSGFKGDTLPVEMVSWEDCREFCMKSGLSLPTEAQWEYACRAGKAGPFAGTGNLDDMGWWRENSQRRTHPVGGKKANAFGLHDMHGNVMEWCRDWYQNHFYEESAGARDPLCKKEGRHRVVRGGRWTNAANSCRSASREFYRPSSPPRRGRTVGFRPAWSSP